MGYLLAAEHCLGPTTAGNLARSGQAALPLLQEATHPLKQPAGRLLQPGFVPRTLLKASAKNEL